MDATALLAGVRLVPVVVIEDVDAAVPLAQCLWDSGLRALEVTLRSGAALASIEAIAGAVPQMLLGAGSVRRAEQFEQVRGAGARFAVSPGASDRLLDAAADTGLAFVPGVATASEMIRLLERDYRLHKFFPAEANGGIATLKALSAPLPEVRFFPTGGITPALAPEYLELEQVACIGGSWFVPAGLLAAGDFEGIAALARDAVHLADG